MGKCIIVTPIPSYSLIYIVSFCKYLYENYLQKFINKSRGINKIKAILYANFIHLMALL